jgi:hypothetical protein
MPAMAPPDKLELPGFCGGVGWGLNAGDALGVNPVVTDCDGVAVRESPAVTLEVGDTEGGGGDEDADGTNEPHSQPTSTNAGGSAHQGFCPTPTKYVIMSA